MRKVFKTNAAKDTDPPFGGGQYPAKSIAIANLTDISHYKSNNDCQKVKWQIFFNSSHVLK